jgi:hypothetical protein
MRSYLVGFAQSLSRLHILFNSGELNGELEKLIFFGHHQGPL